MMHNLIKLFRSEYEYRVIPFYDFTLPEDYENYEHYNLDDAIKCHRRMYQILLKKEERNRNRLLKTSIPRLVIQKRKVKKWKDVSVKDLING